MSNELLVFLGYASTACLTALVLYGAIKFAPLLSAKYRKHFYKWWPIFVMMLILFWLMLLVNSLLNVRSKVGTIQNQQGRYYEPKEIEVIPPPTTTITDTPKESRFGQFQKRIEADPVPDTDKDQ